VESLEAALKEAKKPRQIAVEIDESAGFCPGVRRAIQVAEEAMRSGARVAVLGELIHNRREVERLRSLGLEVIEDEQLDRNSQRACRLLIRTHGLPLAVRERLERDGFEMLDGTCPVVQRSQKFVRQFAARGYQVLIVGKPNHPEVVALIGQAPDAARAVLDPEGVGELDPSRPVFVLAQSTVDQSRFRAVLEHVRAIHPRVEFRDTTCRAVTGRHEALRRFASEHDVVIFVGGKNSSNTGQLFRICQSVNPRSYWVESLEEISEDWLLDVERVGVSGSASTPHWQLEEVARYIQIKAQPLGEYKEVTSNG